MKRFLTLLLCLTPFLFSIEAQEWECCCGGEYYLTVEGLYWRVNHDPIFIVNRSTGNNPGGGSGAYQQTYLYGDYDGGVRGRFGYDCNTFFTNISYLNFGTLDKKDQARGEFSTMNPLGGRPSSGSDLDFVKCLATFRYQNVDLCYGRFFSKTNCLEPFFYANARWVRLDFKYKLQGILADDPDLGYSGFTLDQKAKFQGGGLGIGIGGHYSFLRYFGLNTQLGVMAVLGETVVNNFRSTDLPSSVPTIYSVRPQVWRHAIPGIDFRFGIDYACCFSCFQFSIEVGYELNWYSNILNYFAINASTIDGSRRIPIFEAQEISFGGPFFRLTVGY